MTFQHHLTVLVQLALIIFIWVIAYIIQTSLQLPIASGILGLFLLLLLLNLKWIKINMVEQGAQFLLANLLLFFIPPVVGLIQYQELLLQRGGQLVFAITISTICVMVSSVWSIQWLLRKSTQKAQS
ncbi:CidA/LrgA family protein [Acinetobacter rudis]|uniref:CidA/LrgA family protein n=1 Tax=Acinetobacter rudis TaxID=632955 RepID=A0AAW8J873_9GAMM|nr:CidA/LrgA family protein [Acinetobacter rudis]MDQ8935354.1 CidA/LrgA family protein [Acinetobacter rudis]MDQ9017617.1 CidA/LrgA family protein [Acinetobacter rudis]